MDSAAPELPTALPGIHLVDRVKEAARDDKQDQVGLLRCDQPRMGHSVWKKQALAGRHHEDLTIDVHLHLTRKNVQELIFARVDMGRRFGAPPHFADNEVERPVVVRRPASWLARMPLYHDELLDAGDRM
jgi:hypothetical protein